MTKEDFKILTPREHIRKRPGMYVGSVSLEMHERFLNGKWSQYSYVPAIVKMVDEIIDNSIDEAIRTNFKHANRIFVGLKGNEISVSDNGRGIPIEKIKTPEGKSMFRPVAAWTKTNAGTSFDDERTTIGANGLGSAAVNFMSKKFRGFTGTSKDNAIEVICENGILKKTTQTQCVETGTIVSFEPDMTLFEISNLSDFDLYSLIHDRLSSLSVSFPKIRFFFNEKEITTNIKKYSLSFLEKDMVKTVVEKNKSFEYFICASNDGFHTTSYVNGVNTRLGGSMTDHILNGISDELIALVQKKHKIKINRTLIKSCLTFVSFARDFINPKFDSQTKERLTNTQKEISEYLVKQKFPEFTKLAKDIFDCDEIIEPIIEAQLAKKLAKEKADAKKAAKKLTKAKVAKHVPANKDNGTLFVCEGLSALGFAVDVRDPNKHGFYPLKGVLKNTWKAKASEIHSNVELSDLLAILKLDIFKPKSYENSDYKEIAIMTDADVDGSHIAILLIGFFYRFWPDMFEKKMIKWLRTPIMIASKGKKEEWFYSYESAGKFKKDNPTWTYRYIKGLASLKKSEYDIIINKPVFATIEIDDVDMLEKMLGDDSDVRKDWINGN